MVFSSVYGTAVYGQIQYALRDAVTYTGTFAELVTGADSLGNATLMVSSLSDFVTAADSFVNSAIIFGAIADSLVASNALGNSAFMTTALSENATLFDNIASASLIATAIGDSLAVSDNLVNTAAMLAILTELLTAFDSFNGTAITAPPAWRIFTVTGDCGLPVLTEKTPNESTSYGIDWSVELGSDIIAASAWSSTPSGLSFAGTIMVPPTGTRVVISGGQSDIEYVITNRITTAAGNVLEDSFRLAIENFDFIPRY